MTPVFRFAPSPNGYLHLGHAYSALLNADLARQAGGRLLLRIEDIDITRCRPEFAQAIHEDLAWLGIAFETPVRRQSEHLDAYVAAAGRLAAMGLLYPSYESRAEIARLVAARSPWPHDPDGAPLFPGPARARAFPDEPMALRLDMAAATARTGALTWDEQGRAVAAQPEAWGDVILARKEVPTSYHLSVVIDDALQGVTHVVRGQDLFASTSVHRLLQQLLGLPAPAYHHHPLLLGADGAKLAKSAASTGLRELRAQGATPADIRRMTGLPPQH